MNNEAYLVPNPATPCQPIRIDPKFCISCYRCADQCRTDIMVRNMPMEGGIARCEEDCPAGEAIRWTTYYITRGQFDKALENIREENPFPGVCGRVCFHPCEEQCARIPLDEGIATNALERAAFDYGNNGSTPQKRPATGKTVAVIGGGPAGLSCAYYLTILGHKVTVFEAKQVAGGIPRINIPESRLPASVVDSEVELIAKLGVDIKVNSPVDAEVFKKLTQDYDACFIATGAPLSLKLGVPGEDNENVIDALEFLYQARIENSAKVGKKIVVVGGGNVATDSARLARRLGAEEVTMVCLESRDTMPAYEAEIEAAVAEGVDIFPSWGVREISVKDGKVTGIGLKECVSAFDARGNFNPSYNESNICDIDADTVILAIGQRTDLSFADEKMIDGSRIKTDPITLETPVPGVFAGGDVGSAIRSIVQAIGSAKRAAIAIDKYLKGDISRVEMYDRKAGFIGELPRHEVEETWERQQRATTPTLSIQQRKVSFDEVELAFSEKRAVQETIQTEF